MEISVKLLGMLRDKTPPGGRLELSDNATIEDALNALEIPGDHIQVISVNSQFERDYHRRLFSNDELTIMPTVTGG